MKIWKPWCGLFQDSVIEIFNIGCSQNVISIFRFLKYQFEFRHLQWSSSELRPSWETCRWFSRPQNHHTSSQYRYDDAWWRSWGARAPFCLQNGFTFFWVQSVPSREAPNGFQWAQRFQLCDHQRIWAGHAINHANVLILLMLHVVLFFDKIW